MFFSGMNIFCSFFVAMTQKYMMTKQLFQVIGIQLKKQFKTED